jgi:iron complex transport system substrate-binding protein
MAMLRLHAIPVRSGSLAGVFSLIQTIGSVTGADERATRLVDDLRARLSRVRAGVGGRPAKKVLILVGRRPGTLTDLVAAGRGTYLSDLAVIAGGENVLSRDSAPEYPRLSMESVIRLAPDVIVDAGDMGDTPADRQRRAAVGLDLWRRQTLVRAVALGGVHQVLSDAFVVPGPRVVEVASTLAGWFHDVSVR